MTNQVERKIEWGHGSDHATGNTQGESQLALYTGTPVEGDHFAIKPLGFFSRQVKNLRRPLNLNPCLRENLSLFPGQGCRQPLVILHNKIGRPMQYLVSLVTCQSRHHTCPTSCTLQRSINIIRRTSRHSVYNGPIKRIPDVHSRLAISPRAGNVHLHADYIPFQVSAVTG